jgi:hypothetical protein
MTHVITNTAHLKVRLDAAIDRAQARMEEECAVTMRELHRPDAIRNAHLNLDPSWFSRNFRGARMPTQAEVDEWVEDYLDQSPTYDPSFGDMKAYIEYALRKDERDLLFSDKKGLVDLRCACESDGATEFQVPIRLFNLLGV